MPHLKFVGTSPSWEKASVMKLDMRGLHDNLREKLDGFCDSGAIDWDVLQFFLDDLTLIPVKNHESISWVTDISVYAAYLTDR